MSKPRIFGEILQTPTQASVVPGTSFLSRKDLAKALVHRPIQAGISYAEKEGADSVVLSGGYADDADYGDIILYTGMGGRDDDGHHIADQPLKEGNLALKKNFEDGLAVRVTRGWGHRSSYSPKSGYLYAGIYYVDDYWSEKSSASPFSVFRFRLVSEKLYKGAAPGQVGSVLPPALPPQSPPVGGAGTQNPGPAPRTYVMIQRIIRDTKMAKSVKRLHDHRCQVCSIIIETPIGAYAEAAHIQPLGFPYSGPDISENILCLCANHHVMFDTGAFVINDDFSIVPRIHFYDGQSNLNTVPGHNIDSAYLRYHREIFS